MASPRELVGTRWLDLWSVSENGFYRRAPFQPKTKLGCHPPTLCHGCHGTCTGIPILVLPRALTRLWHERGHDRRAQVGARNFVHGLGQGTKAQSRRPLCWPKCKLGCHSEPTFRHKRARPCGLAWCDHGTSAVVAGTRHGRWARGWQTLVEIGLAWSCPPQPLQMGKEQALGLESVSKKITFFSSSPVSSNPTSRP